MSGHQAFRVTTRTAPADWGMTIFQPTAGKAKAEYWRHIQDVGYDIPFTDMRAQSLGKIRTPLEMATDLVDDFNARYPIGSPVRVYPGRMGDHRSAYETVIKAPGAFVIGGHTVSVKVPGDSIALTHVVPIIPDEQRLAEIPGLDHFAEETP